MKKIKEKVITLMVLTLVVANIGFFKLNITNRINEDKGIARAIFVVSHDPKPVIH